MAAGGRVPAARPGLTCLNAAFGYTGRLVWQRDKSAVAREAGRRWQSRTVGIREVAACLRLGIGFLSCKPVGGASAEVPLYVGWWL